MSGDDDRRAVGTGAATGRIHFGSLAGQSRRLEQEAQDAEADELQQVYGVELWTMY
jgi:hypothetical protein